MNIQKKCVFLMAAMLAQCHISFAAASEVEANWPQRPVRWIVGFAPGGTADILTRIAAEQLAKKLGKSVVVENRPGASGALALNLVANSRPADTLLITVPGPIIFPREEPAIGKGLDPVIMLAEGPMIIVGPASNAQHSFADVITDAKQNPHKWNYATSGTGTSQHLAGEMINQLAGTQMVQVPYKGGGQAVSDVVGAQVPLAILGPTPVLPHIASGALQPYAVTTTYRLPSLKNVPTVAEAGIDGYDASQWFALATTKGVPQQRIERLNEFLSDIVKTQKFREAVTAAGMKIAPGTPEGLLKFIEEDRDKWESLVKQRNLKIGQ
ncbi:ABC transporter substrate-binding protein [Advenella sp. S44]|uniref:Bug family tripartite tricarboxylate transporter substrate binding protein n=1 Tax=Advenella sp. S44 TaxID=1982755 RepID=UPI000C2B395B|nr:tripartite tricarboxylate transporter substrate binding protein [Advenella sp. S44]PJX23398.1 ABC transporter substrate-binding protein [Advenella sp. S44]